MRINLCYALLLAAQAWQAARAASPSSSAFSCLVSDGHVEDDSFRIAAPHGRTLIFTHPSEPALVHIATKSFAKDIVSVIEGGKASASILNATSISDVQKHLQGGSSDGSDRIIIAGSLAGSGSILADAALKQAGENVDSMRGKWEAWDIRPARLSLEGSSKRKVLLVNGADKRGLTYALYTLSEEMGVSPWHWFADVPPTTRRTITTRACSHGSPAVMYRGIFLNDEQPALTNWANKYFRAGNTLVSKSALQQSFLPEFYGMLFDLLLRLKANMLWPAMWADMFAVAGLDALPANGTNGKGAAGPNQVMADRYGIVYSTSHQEPMARNTPEWSNYGTGDWNYTTNSNELNQFWRYGAERAAPYETIFTVGMRGNGDIPLPGASVPLLESLVKEQRQLLSDSHGGKNITSIPQIWCLYKEVQSYYDNDGLQVPDDVTLLWTDDNWGNLRRVPRTNETSRAGGSGLYYHFDYVGDPRNYKWISTINFAKTWEQLNVAQQTGLTRMLILNVGDLKPIEAATHHAMALSYYGTTSERMMAVRNDSTIDIMPWVEHWASQTFPTLPAKDVATIVAGYNALNNRVKPELLNSTTWSLTMYGEAERVLKEWTSISTMVHNLSKKVKGGKYEAAFSQLVSTPAMLSANLNELYTAVGRANLMSTQARTSANLWKDKAEQCFAQDAKLTNAYHTLQDGKWDGILSQPHINYQYWQQPMRNTLPPVAAMQHDAWPAADGYMAGAQTGPILITQEGSMGSWPGDNENNCAQGYSCGSPIMATLDRYNWQKRWFDIASGTWTDSDFKLSTNVSWIKLSSTRGQLKGDGSTDARIWVSLDWDAVESNAGVKYGGITVQPANGTYTQSQAITMTVPVDTFKVDASGHDDAFIGSQGMAAMLATHATSKNSASSGNASWFTIAGYGLSSKGVTTLPPTHDMYDAGKGPNLSFDFYLNSSASSWNVSTFIGPTLNYHAGSPLQYALQLDGADPITVQPIPLASSSGSDPPDWNGVVAAGIRTTTTLVNLTMSTNTSTDGWHNLKVWSMQPGLVIEMVAVGNWAPTSLLPPESYRLNGTTN